MQPSFVIAGAPRAGTTWLYKNLAKHPDVFLSPNKEPRFYGVNEADRLSFTGPGDDGWLSRLVQDRTDYEALYAGAGAGQLCGEASSDYLYRSEIAAARIRDEAPSARILFMLRDPAHRAYSNWLQHVQYGRETLSFGDALEAEEERIELGWAWWWHYARRGFYADQIERFLDAFPSDRILILLYDDLERDPRGLMERICRFLDIDPVVDDQIATRQNQSLVARSAAHDAARWLLKPAAAVSSRALPPSGHERLRRWFQQKTLGPTISNVEYQRLRRTYSRDVERLSGLTGLDLSCWR
ncbi:MAG: sulfotransferase family protein [Mycobacteriales bacterium]